MNFVEITDGSKNTVIVADKPESVEVSAAGEFIAENFFSCVRGKISIDGKSYSFNFNYNKPWHFNKADTDDLSSVVSNKLVRALAALKQKNDFTLKLDEVLKEILDQYIEYKQYMLSGEMPID